MEEALLPRSVTDHVREKMLRIPSKVYIIIGCALTIAYGVACAAESRQNPLVSPLDLATSSNDAPATLKDLITKPDTMYANYGFVPMPILNMCAKAFFTFGVQSLFFLGLHISRGYRAVENRMKEDMQFSNLSIAFQVAGQISAAYSFAKLMLATKCWQGLTPLTKYFYLVSQHNASVSIIVGIANNYVVQLLLPEGCKRTVARVLLATGFFIGAPIWIATASAMWISMYGISFIIGMAIGLYMVCMGCRRYGIRVYEAEGMGPLVWWFMALVSGTMFTSLLWCLMGLWTDAPHAVLMTCATFFELFLPTGAFVFGLGISFNLGKRDTFMAMLLSFALALSISYTVITLVPTSLLAWQPSVRFGDAASQAFWDKKILKYVACTFIQPAYHGMEVFEEHYGDAKYAEWLRLWLAQLLAFFA